MLLLGKTTAGRKNKSIDGLTVARAYRLAEVVNPPPPRTQWIMQN